MKLTELSVDGYGICNNLRLTNLGAGLNVIYGPTGSGKTTLAQYIRNVLYGFESNAAVGHGSLEATINRSCCRLSRTLDSRNQLVISDLQGTSTNGSASTSLKSALDEIGPDTFGVAYLVHENGNDQAIGDLSRIVQQRCGVPVGRIALSNDLELAANTRSIRDRQQRVDSLNAQIAGLERQQAELSRQIEEQESTRQVRSVDIENEIRQVSDHIERLGLASVRNQIDALDREISELRLRIDAGSDQVKYVSRPQMQSDGLAALYKRLDDIDDQIRRWRQVHSDVQQQRVRLKDEMVVWNEMTIDSSGHPYHRARKILTSIESKVGLAERSVGDLQNVQIVSPENTALTADRLNEICNEIRGDLYELCNELGTQYKQIRHRSAAAELKRLRRCYEEIGENIESMVGQRGNVIEEISHLDPEGAHILNRQDSDFCRCAQHEGYLQARRRYAGELPSFSSSVNVIRPDLSLEKSRLSELEKFRADRVRELVAGENRLSELEAQRQSLVSERQRIPTGLNLDNVNSRIETIKLDLTTLNDERRVLMLDIDRDRAIKLQPAHPLLTLAGELAHKLTRGEIHKVWLALNPRSTVDGIEVENVNGHQLSFRSLNPAMQKQLGLSLRLAIVEYFRRRGIELPMILDNVFANLDRELVRATFETILEFCNWGNQVIALTSDTAVSELSRRSGLTTFDMPETSVSPIMPTWSPERTTLLPPPDPEFLTPFTTRLHKNIQQDMRLYPQVKYPPTGHVIDYSPENFETGGSVVRPTYNRGVESESTFDESIELRSLELIDSIDLERLNRLGISTADRLLAVDPNELPADFVDAHITSGQIDNWQSQAWLMMCVPALRPVDAQILVAIGVTEPEQLESSSSLQLVERVNRFLTSTDGQQFASVEKIFDRDLVNSWYESLGSTRSRWRMPSGYSRRSRWSHSSNGRQSTNRFERDRTQNRVRGSSRDYQSSPNVFRERRSGPSRSSSISSSFAANETATRNSAPAETTKLKFYLDLSNDLEAAPSIGPKTAERFNKINVVTIADFLTQTAESMATKIKYKRITADVIRQWQHQARLVCRVPNLRGHDAQLLVACGIIEPEDLANRHPQSLFDMIAPFSVSKEGLKIIRGGKQPDLAEITDWVNWARQTRSLQAA